MTNAQIRQAFANLSTPLVADATLRLELPARIADSSIRPLLSGSRLAGRVLPVRHSGSVDVFLEAFRNATPGDVLVIDNEGRTDEGCIGDLTALEAQAAGLMGIVVWGSHRDSPQLREIGLPIFSLGTFAYGPRRLAPRQPEALRSARVGPVEVTADDVVFADEDGVVFAAADSMAELLATAADIAATERRQADGILAGRTLRDQLRFEEYVARRQADPSVTFRQHLREVGGEIEE